LNGVGDVGFWVRVSDADHRAWNSPIRSNLTSSTFMSSRPKSCDPLEAIAALVPWESFRADIERVPAADRGAAAVAVRAT